MNGSVLQDGRGRSLPAYGRDENLAALAARRIAGDVKGSQIVGTSGTDGTGRTCGSAFAGRARFAAHALRPGRALLPSFALRACRTGRTGRALRSHGSLRTGGPLRPRGPGRAGRPWRALAPRQNEGNGQAGEEEGAPKGFPSAMAVRDKLGHRNPSPDEIDSAWKSI